MLEWELKGYDFKDLDHFNQIIFIIFCFIDLILHLFQHIARGLQRDPSHYNMQYLHLNIHTGCIQPLNQILNQILFQIIRILANQLKLVQDDFFDVQLIGLGQDVHV